MARLPLKDIILPVGDVTPEALGVLADTRTARDQAQTYAAQAVAFQQSAFTGIVNDPVGQGRKALDVATVRAGIPVEKFLRSDESIDTTGAVSMSVRIQRALDEVPLSFGPLQIELPPGRIRLATRLNLRPDRPGVGLRGAGVDQTILVVNSDVKCAVYAYGDSNATPKTFLQDVHLSDFTVDCSAQVAADTDSSFKAFNIGHVKNGRFENLRAINSHASAFGIDYLVNCWFVNCEGFNAGRGMHKRTVLGSGSTFGIGVGAYPDESIYFIDCRSTGAGRMGWNLEWLSEYGQNFATKVFIVGCHSNGDAVGIGDLGSGGIYVSETLIENFTNAGVVIGTGGQAPIGGSGGHITPTTVIRKGIAGGNPSQDVTGGHGVYVRGDQTAGGYTIEPRVEDCAGAAVKFESGWRLSRGGPIVRPKAYRCGGGVVMNGGGQTEVGVRFEDGHYEDCGVALDLRTALLAPSIRRNVFVSNNGAQATPIRFDPSTYVSDPSVMDNTLIGAPNLIVGGGSVLNQHYRDNVTIATVPTPDNAVVYYNTFRASPTAAGLGDGWITVTGGIFTQTHSWQRTRDGGTPITGTGQSGATARAYDVGNQLTRVSARMIRLPADGNRRGIAHSVNPTTGEMVIFEAQAGTSAYRVIRYEAGGTSPVVMFSGSSGSKPGTETADIALERLAGNNWRAYINNELVWSGVSGAVPVSNYVGVFALAGGEGTILNYVVRKTV
ncbi:hypothetical protein B0I12_002576 [Microbacterium hydrothermale]|uniref:hypothetical protein n=1 Tax=Microbacterium hydrothermale TaxID=857427 RepID=UPI002227BD76|nr:hypothetical protein [Microbacterium hydrothermale]MCW2165421.1 hypothetical protein [Microbacterium hydrothermale]